MAQARDTAGVERPHRQLGARLAARLRCDDADGIADLAHVAACQEDPVAGAADADLAPALEDAAHREQELLGVLLEVVRDLAQPRLRQQLALLAENRLARLPVLERLVEVRREDAP